MIALDQISPQSSVDSLCALFRQLDQHLGSPKHGLPESFHGYFTVDHGKQLWMVTKYFRNIAALDKFEAFIDTLDSFFVGVEYYQGKVALTRSDASFPLEYTDKFFISVIADSLRASLDVYAKSLAWYFSLPSKEKLGFGYRSLVLPLRERCKPIADECNTILQSTEFKLLKDYRDADKHIGQGKHEIGLERTKNGFSITSKRPDDLDIDQLKVAAAAVFGQVDQLVQFAVVEQQRWKLGYDASDDEVLEVNPDGTFKSPSNG
jgi:hypothetical protein